MSRSTWVSNPVGGSSSGSVFGGTGREKVLGVVV